jgi:hypothetical protein
MHQSILALPIPPGQPPGICTFFARGSGIDTCKIVPGAGNYLLAWHLTRPDVSATNTCYYIKMASKLINIDEFEGKNQDFVAFCRYFHSQNVTPIAHEKLIKVVFDYLA